MFDVSNVFSGAVAQRIISAPQFPLMIEGAPFHSAVCAVELPKGCLPPVGGKRRIATGYSEDASVAAIKAMGEAVERYSMQHGVHTQNEFVPFWDSLGRSHAVPAELVCLGHPDSPNAVRSFGSAAREDRDSATVMAALELIEKRVISKTTGIGQVRELPTDAVDDTKSLSWLHDHLRVADFVVYDMSPNCYVIHCRVSDFDGSRPTYGSAAGSIVQELAKHALKEAAFHWINFALFEAKFVEPAKFAGEDLHWLKVYRGATAPEVWPSNLTKLETVDDLEPVDHSCLLQFATELVSNRVRALDLSQSEEYSVVKLHVG